MGEVRLPEPAAALAIDGGTIFAATNTAGMQVLDVTNAAAPVVVASAATGHATRDVAAAAGYVYAATGAGLDILEVADPRASRRVASVPLFGAADVAVEGGRIYLAKDSFTRKEHYRAMDPRIDGFNAVRDRWDPSRRWKSALSVRLLGDEA